MSPVDVPSSSSTTAHRVLIVYIRYYAFRSKHITGFDWRRHAGRTGSVRISWSPGIRADESRSTRKANAARLKFPSGVSGLCDPTSTLTNPSPWSLPTTICRSFLYADGQLSMVCWDDAFGERPTDSWSFRGGEWRPRVYGRDHRVVKAAHQFSFSASFFWAASR